MKTRMSRYWIILAAMAWPGSDAGADEILECTQKALSANLMGTWRCNNDYLDPRGGIDISRTTLLIAPTEGGYTIDVSGDDSGHADVQYLETAMRYDFPRQEGSDEEPIAQVRVIGSCVGPDQLGFTTIRQQWTSVFPGGQVLSRADFAVSPHAFRFVVDYSRDGETWRRGANQVCVQADASTDISSD